VYDNSIALMSAMSEAGIEHRSDTPLDDDNLIDTVRVSWAGANLPLTQIRFRINDRGARLETGPLGTVGPAARGRALELVNALNGEYRWVTFVLDEGGGLSCVCDVLLVPEVAGLFGIAAMGRMFDTLDEVHPRLRPYLASR